MSLFTPIQLGEVYTAKGLTTEEAKRPFFAQHPDEPESLILSVDNSTMEKFQTCPRSAKYYCIDRKEGPSSPALVYGSAIHECLEYYYRAREAGETITLNAMADLIAKEYEGLTLDPKEWRTEEQALKTMTAYCKHYQYETLNIVHNNGDLFIEKPFSLCLGKVEINENVPYDREQLVDPQAYFDNPNPAPNPTTFIKNIYIHWTGKIDVVAKLNGKNYIMDHKTTSIGGANFFADFALRQQTVGYAWAVQQILGEPVAGFYLNAIIGRKPTKTGKSLELVREIFPYEPWLLDEWKSDVMRECENFVDAFVQQNFPKVTSWCMGKYGRCKYHEVCTTAPNLRNLHLHSDAFSNVTWSPLAKEVAKSNKDSD